MFTLSPFAIKQPLPRFASVIGMALIVSALGLSATMSAEPTAVRQIDLQFKPGTLAIKAGDAVIFRNDDSVPHHVVSHTPLFRFDLDLQLPGKESKVVFDKKGVVVVSCDIHPTMEMTVTVE
jgi:plastocyanin